VKVNKTAAKPATVVKPGDTVEAWSGERERILEITAVIEKRAGAPLASSCYVDHSPPPPSKEEGGLLNFVRERGTGRPTKRDRRQLDRARKQ
jgi:ribosome-associated heat shock protein Hsp15